MAGFPIGKKKTCPPNPFPLSLVRHLSNRLSGLKDWGKGLFWRLVAIKNHRMNWRLVAGCLLVLLLVVVVVVVLVLVLVLVLVVVEAVEAMRNVAARRIIFGMTAKVKRLQVSSDLCDQGSPGWSFYGDYTIQLYRDDNKPL